MTKLLKALPLAVAALAIAAPTASFAQYVGPDGTVTATTVAEILKNPVDDKQVTLEGVLTKKIGDEKYSFKDATGDITVEIDNKIFPATPVDEKTKVSLTGEIDTGKNRAPEVDVDRISIVK